MYSPLDPVYYLSPALFQREQTRLFQQLWILVGLKQMLPTHQSYITRRVGGVPVVIQNFNGELRAFENSCLHRQMPLQQGLCGKRPLTCRYHGWSYDEAGMACHIPHASELYQFCEPQDSRLTLKSYALATIGDFIFVNLSPEPIPIHLQFSEPVRQSLEAVSAHFDPVFIHSQQDGNFNWKLIFENVLDALHPYFLHKTTFPLQQPLPPVPPVDWTQMLSALPDLSDLSFMNSQEVTPRPYRRWHDGVVPYGTTGQYHNWLLYPNINFFCNGGVFFGLQQFEPVSYDKTRILFVLFTAKRQTVTHAENLSEILWAQFRGETRTMLEDIQALESLQANLSLSARPAYQGAYESHIWQMNQWYQQQLHHSAPVNQGTQKALTYS